MPARTRQIGVPLRHERDGEATARGELLHLHLEERRLVGHRERVVVANRDLVDARAGLRVQALDRNVERLALVENRVTEFAVLPFAHPRVAEHAGRERREAAEA